MGILFVQEDRAPLVWDDYLSHNEADKACVELEAVTKLCRTTSVVIESFNSSPTAIDPDRWLLPCHHRFAAQNRM